ncbi:MAG TPA: pyridoxal phosphate-dependent aminotransferase family protein [bacterium]|nr:pyridoxal phosphate-dependent aminotransferase family protein [bacterium]
MDLFDKCSKFTVAKTLIQMGMYPYFNPLQSQQDTRVTINGHQLIMIGSNNYLGLTTHPKVKEASIRAVEKYGTSCSGSRFLNGTLDIHEELEARLARFMKQEEALAFSTGFQTNLGTISALISKDDAVITDKTDHASIIDGCRLSYGQTLRFKHNDMKELERALISTNNHGGKLVIVDGVFSMEGDIAPLPEILQLCKRYGARIMVDDAHSIGILGENGRGTSEHFHVEDQVDLVMGTFSKSFASLGGFVVGKKEVVHYIKHHARSLIFSASMSPASVAATLASLTIIETEPERREKLWRNTRKMKEGFTSLGFDTGASQSPVIPIIIGDDLKTFKFWKEIFNEGVYVNPVVSPGVAPGRSLLRTSYMATHTDEDLDLVLNAFERVGKRLGVI